MRCALLFHMPRQRYRLQWILRPSRICSQYLGQYGLKHSSRRSLHYIQGSNGMRHRLRSEAAPRPFQVYTCRVLANDPGIKSPSTSHQLVASYRCMDLVHMDWNTRGSWQIRYLNLSLHTHRTTAYTFAISLSQRTGYQPLIPVQSNARNNYSLEEHCCSTAAVLYNFHDHYMDPEGMGCRHKFRRAE